MISPELVRRYPFSAGLTDEQIVALAQTATEQDFPAGAVIFKEGDRLCCVYVVVQGAVAINIAVPDKGQSDSVADQITGEMPTTDITVSTAGTGEVFAWSALVEPYLATASAVTLTDCKLIAFDCNALRKIFKQDCNFGYKMMQVAIQIARDRLRDTRVESLMLAAQRQSSGV